MAILTLQRRLRQIGRIRIGDKTDRGAPHKLENFRLTSQARDILEQAAALYGGTIEEWKEAPDPGTYELYTDVNTLPVLVPPGQTLSQNFELWSGGGCKRRCDGVTEQLTDQPCLCPEDIDERRKLAQAGKACHLSTRLSVILYDLGDLGVWRIDSSGWYAATELAGTFAILEKATSQGVILPAQLRLEQRSVKRGGSTMRYAVPVLEMPATTARQLLSGLGMIPEIAAPVQEPVTAWVPVATHPAIAAPVAQEADIATHPAHVGPLTAPPAVAVNTAPVAVTTTGLNLADPATMAGMQQNRPAVAAPVKKQDAAAAMQKGIDAKNAAPPAGIHGKEGPAAPAAPAAPVVSLREAAMAATTALGWSLEEGRAWLLSRKDLKTNEERLAALQALLSEQKAVTAAADSFFGDDGEEYTPPADEGSVS